MEDRANELITLNGSIDTLPEKGLLLLTIAGTIYGILGIYANARKEMDSILDEEIRKARREAETEGWSDEKLKQRIKEIEYKYNKISDWNSGIH